MTVSFRKRLQIGDVLFGSILARIVAAYLKAGR
jgi:hypothetical protein